jgi:hypothetical protein
VDSLRSEISYIARQPRTTAMTWLSGLVRKVNLTLFCISSKGKEEFCV